MTAHPIQLTPWLSTSDLWTLHHVLLDRIELERRSPSTVDPPPIEVFRAFEKLEAGDHLFTPSELRRVRGELRRYLDRTDAGARQDRAPVERVIDRITVTLAGQRRSRTPLSPDRRTRPR